MKKKIISALLAAVMVFSLTACGGGSDKKSADGTYYNTYLDTDPTTMDPVKGNDTYSMGNPEKYYGAFDTSGRRWR